MFKLPLPLIFLFLCLNVNLSAQKATVHGTISDAENGEALIGATVLDKATGTGVVTNNYGFFSLALPQGKHTLIISYVGFGTKEMPIQLNSDQQLNVELEAGKELIEEVVITAEGKNQNVTSTRMSVQKMDAKQIEQVPVLFGEADVMKAIKLLPGVATTSETSSNISVRGGAFDQNLILLDEATIYSASHMGGLFSVFNNDAINSVEFYKGSFPAQYGSRLSSVIDIRMKEGSTKNFHAKGNIGLISTKATLEIPIIKDKLGVLISGRRTYFDLLAKLANAFSDDETNIPYYFYDLNAKINYKINDNNRVFLSGYFGRDVFDISLNESSRTQFEWGNYTGTIRWNSILSKKLFMNATLITSKYDFLIDNDMVIEDDVEMKFKWTAFMKDYSAKLDYGYFLNANNTVKFGGVLTYHDFSTGKVKGKNDTTNFDFQIPKYYALEYAAYVSNKQKITSSFFAEYGLRFSFFNNIGPGADNVVENYEVTETNIPKKFKTYNFDYGIEPRLSLTYIFNDKNSVKAGYARTKQYVLIASNSFGGTPIDVWIPVTNNIDPQYADQVTVGYFRNFFNNQLEASAELYYKSMQNQVEFRAFSQPFLNDELEEDLRFGMAESYGLEAYLSKPQGKINGWISYTYSFTHKIVKDYWTSSWFPSAYDMPHNFAIVTNYMINDRINVSANWVFQSGKPFDSPICRFNYENVILPGYGDKFQSRYPAYHRLDVSCNIQIFRKSKIRQDLNVSVYNAYNQKNSNIIYFEVDKDKPYVTHAYRFSLLPRIVTFAYLFEF